MSKQHLPLILVVAMAALCVSLVVLVVDRQKDLQEQITVLTTGADEAVSLRAQVESLREENAGFKSRFIGIDKKTDGLVRVFDSLEFSQVKLSETVKKLQAGTLSAGANTESTVARTVCRIMKVNTEFNYVVVDAGEDKAMKKGLEGELFRDGQVLGRVKISSVEKSMSIANLIDIEADLEFIERDYEVRF